MKLLLALLIGAIIGLVFIVCFAIGVAIGVVASGGAISSHVAKMRIPQPSPKEKPWT